MPWVKLDDKFHRNPKVLAMSDAAHRIYTDGLSYCADMALPTGFLATAEAIAFVKARGKSMKVIAELVALDAWEVCDEGYLVHDFEVGLPRSSTERVRLYRDRKRAGVTRDVTLVQPASNQDVTTPETVTPRGRATPAHGAPEPEPEPVTRNAPSPSPAELVDARDEPKEDADYATLAQGLETLLGQILSAADLTEARSWIVDFAYLSPQQMLDRVGNFTEWRVSQGLGQPRTVRSCRGSLTRENGYQADTNGRKAERKGFQRIEELV